MNNRKSARNILILVLVSVSLLLSACGGEEVLGRAETEPGDLTAQPTQQEPELVVEEINVPETEEQPSPTSTPLPSNTPPPNLGIVYYFSGGNLQSIDLYDLTIQQIISVGTDVNGAALSPDYSYFAYSRNDQLVLLDTNTSENLATIQGNPGETVYVRDFNPASTSDYSQLLVRRENSTGSHFGLVNISQAVLWTDLPNPPTNSDYGCDTGSSWSPKGDRILVTGLGYGLPCNTNPGATLISQHRGLSFSIAETKINNGLSEDNEITAGARTPTWSGDGAYMYVSMDSQATAPYQFTSQIFRLRDDGSDKQPITSNTRGIAAYPISPTPDLLLYSLSGDSPQTDGIYIHRISDGQNSLEVKGTGLCPLALSTEDNILLFGRLCDTQGKALELNFKFLGESNSTTIARSSDGLPISFLGWKR